jgi:hypothetical protein
MRGPSGSYRTDAPIRPSDTSYLPSNESRVDMNPPHPVHWLSEQARHGLRELPSNAAWLLSRAAQPAEVAGDAAGSAASSSRDTARRVKASVIDATPIGGDSVETRMKRARDAAERAREAEERALEAAQDAKGRSEYAREISDRNRTRVADVKREARRSVDQRTADARRIADEQIERERAEARAEADAQVERVQKDAEEESQSAQHDAEAAQERAKELLGEATARLRDARQLADEATRVARAAAEEARQQAEQLVDDAEQQARRAETRVAAAEQVREEATTRARETARAANADRFNGDLASHTKAELLQLAASIDIEGRTNMTKAELVRAINRASRGRR